MPGNAREFQKSITAELNVIKNRVRNLIGDRHWGEEGRYKETILRSLLSRFLPAHLSVGTGFILDANGNNDNDNQISSQLDIIIYDNQIPLLFKEGEFIIVTSTSVKGIIEVKTRITHSTLPGIVRRFDDSIQEFVHQLSPSTFLGIFSYSFEGNITSDSIHDALVNSQRRVNHISLGTDYFIRRWRHADIVTLGGTPVNCVGDFYNLYEIQELSFSYFISNLISMACGGLQDRYWYSFPLEGTKELNRLNTFCF